MFDPKIYFKDLMVINNGYQDHLNINATSYVT
jgi:hypothetical protein